VAVHVLIVDDEPSVRTNLAAYLEDEDMCVHALSSAEHALELVRSGLKFDVCVMDMRLPGMNGNEAIRALHAACSGLRFVVHTGTAGYRPPDEFAALGVTPARVFRKPLADMEPLAAAVRELMKEHG